MVRSEPSTEDAGLMMLAFAFGHFSCSSYELGVLETRRFFYGEGVFSGARSFPMGKPLVGLFIPMIPILFFL